jgi:hypothetical protein
MNDELIAPFFRVPTAEVGEVKVVSLHERMPRPRVLAKTVPARDAGLPLLLHFRSAKRRANGDIMLCLDYGGGPFLHQFRLGAAEARALGEALLAIDSGAIAGAAAAPD